MGQKPSVPQPGTTIQVIGAGLPRTGTASFSKALEILLEGPTFHCGTQATLGPPIQIKTWIQALKHWAAGGDTDKKALLELLARQYDGYAATTDSPGGQLVPELMALYPDAKVICTVRDPVSWEKSMNQVMHYTFLWFLRGVLFPLPGMRHFIDYLTLLSVQWKRLYDEDVPTRKTYYRHIEWLKEVVPEHRLVFYDVRDGWEPLCKALGKEVPKDIPFPHINDGEAIEKIAKLHIRRGLTRTNFSHISVKPLHPTFTAEVSGVDFSSPIPDDVFSEVLAALTKYGVLVFRKTGLTDESHIAFSKQLGELDDVTPYIKAGRPNRLKHVELFDVSNIELDGSILDPSSPRAQANKGNSLFHVDSSFNPRRAGYSLLLAHELPPPGMGGSTEFADTRAAFDNLPRELRNGLLANDYVACHSMHHSKKVAAPEAYADIEPLDYPMGRHKIVQRHEASGRMNLYIAAHVHHIEGLDPGRSDELFQKLFRHATREENIVRVKRTEPGDLIVWDNTCVMHRAVGGQFVNKFRRDMRRCTVHDSSSMAWGLNEHTDVRQGLP
ncbi:uncharacterized protein N7503_011823 [Penicillium pulvis]|uniref:uncharacterized protein n=1 Tax=Penicillium pulvis TaxID=1562058 RepID=UPI0025488B6A|nr:uncharacterized protein N7503_011823 [Penicillium pulvis]KAJ5786611.1 hypothetical protein N7503_011823 [Penicillium pulvis]